MAISATSSTNHQTNKTKTTKPNENTSTANSGKIAEDSSKGVEEYRQNHENSDSTFTFYNSNEENFNLDEYREAIQTTSQNILRGYDSNNDGEVTRDEFTDGLMNDFALDMIEYNAKYDGEPENAQEAVLGAYRASDSISTILANIDLNNNGNSGTISVEELATVLEYVDVYGYHDVEGSSFMTKDENGHGVISKAALLSLYDYFTDGGTNDIEAGKKYRNGEELTEQEESEVKDIMANGIMAMMQQAMFFNIDLSRNSNYSDNK